MSEFTQNLSAVRVAAAEDFRTSTPSQALGFLATMSTLTLHEAAMIEALFAVGTHSLEWSGNPLVVAAAMGGFSLAVETGLSAGISNSIENFSRATGELKNRFFKKDVDAPKQKENKVLNAIDYALFAAALGSPGVILRDYSKHPDKTLAENKRTGYRAARGLSAVNATLGLVIGGGAVLSENLGAEVVPDTLVNLGNNPYFYAATFGIVATRAAIAKRMHTKHKKAAITGN
ncbi:hypothetical protein H7Y63_04275 [Polaromonas sp.]|nr:hypothetical protein [Candidatus Saccharibacteria bacterium]